MTGPVTDNTFLIPLSSSDPTNVPIQAATQLIQDQVSGAFSAPSTTGGALGTQTITAFGTKVKKTATLSFFSVK